LTEQQILRDTDDDMKRRFPRRLATLLALILAGLLPPGAAASASPTGPAGAPQEGQYCDETIRYAYERAPDGTWLQCLPLVAGQVYRWTASAGPGLSTPPPVRTDQASPGAAVGMVAVLVAVLAAGGVLLLAGRRKPAEARP
jgi:hypothetical protein